MTLFKLLIHFQDRPSLISEFYELCNFQIEPKTSKPETLFGITEILMRYSQCTSEQRIFLVRNFESHFANHVAKENLSLKLVQSLHRLILTMINLKDWVLVETAVKVTILKNPYFPLDNDEYQKEILKMFDTLMKYGFEQKSLMKVCEEVAESFSHSSEVHKLSFEILQWMFSKRNDTINEKDLRVMRSKYYDTAKVKKTSVFYQKITSMIAKFFTLKVSDFEMTSECFTAYHHLVIGLFHVFRTVADEDNVYTCCSDIKRHEVHNTNISVFSFAIKLMARDKFNASVAKHLNYHVSYDAQISCEMRCKSKEKNQLISYNRIYAVFYEFNKNLDPEIFSYVNECIIIIFKLWNSLSKEMQSSRQEPHGIVLRIYDILKDKKNAVTSSNGIASIMKRFWNSKRSGKEVTRMLMKNVFLIREISSLLGFSSSYEFRKSKNYKDAGFCPTGDDIPLNEFLLLEITAISRYCPNENIQVLGDLLMELFSITKEPKILAKSCQVINEAILNTIDLEKFQKVTKILEVAEKNFDFEISLALALNNYYMYNFLFEKTAAELKKDDKKAIEKLDLKKELEQFKYLNESLRHFTDVVGHLMACKDDLDKIQSTKRLSAILHNMAVQFNVRGIQFKDFEAFTLLWNFSNFHEENICTLLNVGTFFLDNYQLLVDSSGNKVRVSKKMKLMAIEDVLAKLNKLVDEEYSPNYQKLSPSVQCHVASYLLSLWVYYLSNGRKSDGVKRVNQFKSLWQSIEIPKDSASFETIRSKLYFCFVEINVNCFNRCADNFLSISVGIIKNVKIIDRDFSFHFYQIYHRINFKAINYSLNRLSDMNHYDSVTLSLIHLAARKGYCFKVLELLSLSILRNLSMEKIDHAKVKDLKILTFLYAKFLNFNFRRNLKKSPNSLG